MKRIAVAMMIAGGLMAVPSVKADDTKPEGQVQTRKERQQQRIGEGVENGSLTAKEATHLEKKETKLNHEIRKDRVANGGNLTNKEKRQINRQQNKLSRDVEKQKHDAQKQPQ